MLARAARQGTEFEAVIEGIVAGARGGVAAIATAGRVERPEPLFAGLARIIATAGPDTLATLQRCLPTPSTLFGPTNLGVAAAVVDRLRRAGRPGDEAAVRGLAEALNRLGVQLSQAGRHTEAVAADQEATALYRTLSAARRDADVRDLAVSLSNLVSSLAAVGRGADALISAEEAVALRRQMIRPDSDR